MSANNIRGQWLGTLLGDPGGFVLLDLDERSDRYTGTALFMPHDASVPHTGAFIDTAAKGTDLAFPAVIFPVHQRERRPLTPAEFADAYPGAAHENAAQIKLRLEGEVLLASFTTAISQAAGELKQYDEMESSHPADGTCTWAEFKAIVGEMEVDNFVWRGQSAPWSLRTSFHRTGRVDLRRYVGEDIDRLKSELLPFTNVFLEANSPTMTSALYNLAQHHGFPTPVLDWTFSPYVAAFFAFRSRPSSIDGAEQPARIFSFDRANWPYPPAEITAISHAEPHATLMLLPPLENNRASPQQALGMLTNVVNIELWIAAQEQRHEKRFLQSYDLPWSEREKAMRDLRVMGITAASMFPGLDGVCEALKHRLFDGG